jgi:hypothetical protein
MQTQSPTLTPSRPPTHRPRTESPARCVETTGRTELFCNGESTPLTRAQRQRATIWLMVETAKSLDPSPIRRVHSALVSGGALHEDGRKWLLEQTRDTDTHGDIARGLYAELVDCGQVAA